MQTYSSARLAVVVVVVVVVVVLIQRLRPLGHAREASLSRLPRPERSSSRLYTIGPNSSLPRPPPLRTGRKSSPYSGLARGLRSFQNNAEINAIHIGPPEGAWPWWQPRRSGYPNTTKLIDIPYSHSFVCPNYFRLEGVSNGHFI